MLSGACQDDIIVVNPNFRIVTTKKEIKSVFASLLKKFFQKNKIIKPITFTLILGSKWNIPSSKEKVPIALLNLIL